MTVPKVAQEQLKSVSEEIRKAERHLLQLCEKRRQIMFENDMCRGGKNSEKIQIDYDSY